MTHPRALIALAVAAIAILATGCGGGDDRSVQAYCVDEFEAMVEEHPDYYDGIDPVAGCEETIAESGETRAAVDEVLKLADAYRSRSD